MASSDSNQAEGGGFYAYDPLRARGGQMVRRAAVQKNSGEIQLQIDDLEQGHLIAGVTDLRTQVRQLRNVSEEIQAEAKYDNYFVSQLQKTLTKAQTGLKNNTRRLNQSIAGDGSNHVKHVVLFAVVCFIVVYLWFKFSGK